MRDLQALLNGRGPGVGEILDTLGEAVTIRDRGERILYANRAALSIMGFSSLDEMQRRPPDSIMGDYIVTDEHGMRLTMDDIPSVRLLRGEPVDPLLIRTVHRASGQQHWNVLKASALHDADGEIGATVMIIEDVTVVKDAELRSRFLAEASRQLASSLDYAQTLRNVAWAAVPQIADWCGVDLVDDRGRRERVVAAHRDPDKLVLAERLREFEPPRLDPQQGIGLVVRTGVLRAVSEHYRRDARPEGRRQGAPAVAARTRDAIGADRRDPHSGSHPGDDVARVGGVRPALHRGRRASPSSSPIVPRSPSRTHGCTGRRPARR